MPPDRILTDDEMALVLFSRMLFHQPVWVDSPIGQLAWITLIGKDDNGRMIALDHTGQDRPVRDYLLADPRRGLHP